MTAIQNVLKLLLFITGWFIYFQNFKKKPITFLNQLPITFGVKVVTILHLILLSQPSTSNLQPSTFNLQPFNLKPSTLNLKPLPYASIINIVLFQFSVECSFTYTQIGRSIFTFPFVFFQGFNYEFFLLIHNVQRFFYLFMMMYIVVI